jgi:rod shape-determining protein MreC
VRNLLDFIARFSNVFLFLLLQIICARAILKHNQKLNESYLDNSRKIAGGLIAQKNSVTDYYFLREINDSLINENKRLREKIYQQEIGIPISDSFGNVTYLKDSVKKEFRYKYYAAKVLNNTFDEANNYVTLNKGINDSVKIGMAVLSSNGIVGQIVSAGAKYSVAKSVLSSRFRVSAKLKDGNLGYITWPDLDCRFVTLNDIGPTINVKQGDTIYTSGYSLFPANIMIGRVAAVYRGSEANKYKVLLSTNFKRLHYVYIAQDITQQIIAPIVDSAKVLDMPIDKKNKAH